MKRSAKTWAAILLATAAVAGLSSLATAQEYYVVYYPAEANPWYVAPPVPVEETPQYVPLTDDEIDQLMGPIALYPDPLLAQILPASTYPDDVAQAAEWLRGILPPDDATIDANDWDPSVKALARYPEVLQMMGENIEWTQAVGAAFLNQREDLLASVQRLRQAALDARNLQDSPQQQVIVTPAAVEILPADPEIIYVPRYDPAIVYVRIEEPHIFPFITFGIGRRIGLWLDCGLDWDHHWIAVGSGWHNGWVYLNRRWYHDDSVRIDRRTVLYRNNVRLPVPVTRPWVHDPRKPPPRLPQPLAQDVRRQILGRVSGAAPHPVPVPVPFVKPPVRQEPPPRFTPYNPPPLPRTVLGTNRTPEEVTRERQRYLKDRPPSTPLPVVKPVPAPPMPRPAVTPPTPLPKPAVTPPAPRPRPAVTPPPPTPRPAVTPPPPAPKPVVAPPPPAPKPVVTPPPPAPKPVVTPPPPAPRPVVTPPPPAPKPVVTPPPPTPKPVVTPPPPAPKPVVSPPPPTPRPVAPPPPPAPKPVVTPPPPTPRPAVTPPPPAPKPVVTPPPPTPRPAVTPAPALPKPAGTPPRTTVFQGVTSQTQADEESDRGHRSAKH